MARSIWDFRGVGVCMDPLSLSSRPGLLSFFSQLDEKLMLGLRIRPSSNIPGALIGVPV